MPIYEYQCDSCSTIVEQFAKSFSDSLTDCTVCKKGKLNRVVSRNSCVLKGGGWYKDLYQKPQVKEKKNA